MTIRPIDYNGHVPDDPDPYLVLGAIELAEPPADPGYLVHVATTYGEFSRSLPGTVTA